MEIEFKFRAWDEGKMLYHIAVKDSIAYYLGENLSIKKGSIGHVIMQYSGINDKNGKEIYEGDILSYESKTSRYSSRTKNSYYLVEFKNGNFVSTGYNGDIQVIPDLNHRRDFEIIGNIYENPSLLQ